MNMNDFKDYYKILGVSKESSAAELKKRYRELAIMYHPDKYSDLSPEDAKYQEIEARMKEINEAYTVLKNPSSRERYDADYVLYYSELKAEQMRREQARKQREQERARMQREHERRQQEESERERRRRANSRTYQNQNSNRRAAYGYSATYDEYEEDYETTLEYLKRIWNEVREEEKANPFGRRHYNLSRRMNKNRRRGDVPHEIAVNFGHGVIHISYELYHQLSKFGKIKEDTLPKYVIRNRKSIAAIILAASMAFGGIGGATSSSKDASSDTSISMSQEADTNSSTGNSMEDGVGSIIDEMNSRVYMTRYYKIKGGDTLSQLAEEFEIPLSTIKQENNIQNASLIQMGQTIKIPYTIYESDVKYYSQAITITAEQLQKLNALEEIASLYGTDVQTLYNLNPEAIKKTGTTYTLESDSILVPKFAKKSEVKLEKDKQSTNQQ